MSKAEDLAKELYPLLETDKIGNNPYISYNTEQLAKQEGYVEGYHQAEKDLELTWEDIEKITDIWDDLHEDETVYIKTGYDTPEFYQEVLKRFKDLKNKLNNMIC